LRQVRVESAAKADIQRAFVWYETQREGLGERFVEQVRATIERIALNPEGYAKIIKDARKAEVEKFPYSIWFHVRDDVVVIACLHGKRDRRLAVERASGVIQMPDPS
jgi:toxin ParE1/3/4